MSENQELMVPEVEIKDVAMAREPEIVLAEATKAAKALQSVIASSKKPVIFNGEQYLEFEHWTTVGKFYGLYVKTRDALPVEIQGVEGARAMADVVEIKTGQIIGGAEAYCMRDEKNWSGKPWFQLASMAQTRAGAKALRNVLSWVVVLAGYRPTPAEEMQEIERTQTVAPEPPQDLSHEVISVKQAGRFYGIAKSVGKTDEQIKKFLMENYGIDNTKKIAKKDYENLCDWAAQKVSAQKDPLGQILEEEEPPLL